MKNRFLNILAIMLISIGIYAQPSEDVYEGTQAIGQYVNNDFTGPLDIGFDFIFFGNTYSQFYVNPNGLVTFGAGSTDPSEDPIPTAGTPNNFIAAFWDDLYTDGHVLYSTIGASPNRKLTIQWKNMLFYPIPTSMFGTFSLILYESTNVIQVQFRLIVDNINERAHGSSATIGLENSDGSAGVQYAYHVSDAVYSEQAISFTPSGGTYTIDSDAEYDGIYLTTTPLLPEPGIATLISPPQDADIGSDFTFVWGSAPYATSYSLRISKSSNLNSPTVYDAGSNLSYDVTGLDLDDTYYWGVFATNATGTTWCEIQRFTTSSTPLLVPVPQTIWAEQYQDNTIELQYTGGDESPKTAVITSLPTQGELYQYDAGSRGSQITSVPTDVTDSEMKIIYAATGTSGNGVGNFDFLVNDAGGDSDEATITVNVSPPGVPNVLYVAKSTNVEIRFDIPMADPTGKQDQFTVTVDESPVTVSSASLKPGDVYTILLTLATPLTGIETVYVSYTPGDVQGSTGGYLFSFTDQLVTLTAQTINFSQSLDKKYSDSPLTITATASSDLSLTYNSSNTSVATFMENKLYFHALGTSVITLNQAGNVTFAPAGYVKTLTVSKGDQTITFDALPDKTEGDPDFDPGASASSTLPVSYSSDNLDVATIVSEMIHIVAAGSANITASQAGNDNYNAADDVIQPLTVDVLTGVENPFSLQHSFKLYSGNSQIYIQPLNDEWNGEIGSVRVFNIIGKPVMDLQNAEFVRNSIIQVPAPATKGIYLVEMRSGIKRFVGKIVIK